MSQTNTRYSDLQILAAFRQGGQARELAWEYVYKAWRPLVVGAIVNAGGTADEALEAFQDIAVGFEQCVRKKEFILRNKLSTYLVKCVINRWRRVKMVGGIERSHELDDHDLVSFVESVENEMIAGELGQALDEVLSKIGERCKRILVFCYLEEYPMKEISQTMGFKNEQVARNEKMKCLNALKDYLRTTPSASEQLKYLRDGR